MQLDNMTVGRGSTRGRRRGLTRPASSLEMERRLALTWEGHWSDMEGMLALETTPRRAITWEGVRPEHSKSQVGVDFKKGKNAKNLFFPPH